jgi:putative acetyltransferase
MSIGPQRVKIRPYAAGDAKAALAIFTNAITETATADYSPEQLKLGPAPESMKQWRGTLPCTSATVLSRP